MEMTGNTIGRPSSLQPPVRVQAQAQPQQPDAQTLQALLALLMMMQGGGMAPVAAPQAGPPASGMGLAALMGGQGGP